MSEWTFVGVAYGLTWLVLSGYALYLARRLSRARASFDRLQQSEGAGS